jgi:hypothetical protein
MLEFQSLHTTRQFPTPAQLGEERVRPRAAKHSQAFDCSEVDESAVCVRGIPEVDLLEREVSEREGLAIFEREQVAEDRASYQA